MRTDYLIQPSDALNGVAAVPGDKSISHRAVLLGGISSGRTSIHGFLEGEDTLATLAAFEAMGVGVERHGGEVALRGLGLRGLSAPAKALDLGNSGTAMRLMTGLLAGQAFSSTLTGDDSLCSRPMGRITEPLQSMGARIETALGNTAPLTIHASGGLSGIRYELPVASAQVKSAVLLAGLYANGVTQVTEPATTRDHTERMLRGFGYNVDQRDGVAMLTGGGTLTGTTVAVPGDLSSAAFFIVGACISEPGSRLVLTNIGVNPTRDGVLRILEAMGARITLRNRRESSGEPVADIEVEAGPLHGIEVPAEWVPLAIDEFPVLMIAAAAASGVTTVRGAQELRVKESDRIAAMADGLSRIGVDCEETHDGMVVRGGHKVVGGRVSSYRDHRIAMAFTMAGLLSEHPIHVEDCANVATSFPGFVTLAQSLGLTVTNVDEPMSTES
jgi:3-phosphoshikimate 1-carboxyvinyltransferase